MIAASLNNVLQLDGGHAQTDHRNFLFLQFPKSDAAEYPILDAMIRESIDENVFQDFFHTKPQSLVGANSARGKLGIVRAAHSTGKCKSSTNYEAAPVPTWNAVHSIVQTFATGAIA